MDKLHITSHNTSLFSHRITFNGIDDTKIGLVKKGVRDYQCFNPFFQKIAVFFLKLFKLIEEYKTAEGTTIYLNKKDYLQWREQWHKYMQENPCGEQPQELPSPMQISEYLDRKYKEELKESLQKIDTQIEEKGQQLVEKEKNLNESERELESLHNRDSKLKKVINELKEIEKDRSQIDQEEENDIFDRIRKGARELALDTKAFMTKVKRDVPLNETLIDQIVKLEEARAELEIEIDHITSQVDALKHSVNDLSSELTTLVNNREKLCPVILKDQTELLNYIEENSHQKIAEILRILLGKFDQDVVESIRFNPRNQECTLKLHQTIRLWTEGRSASGEKEKQAPNGRVLLLGDNPEKEVKFSLDKKTRSVRFNNGYQIFLLAKMANAKVKLNVISMQYDPNTDSFTNNVDGHADLPVFGPKKIKEERHIPFDIIKKDFVQSEVVPVSSNITPEFSNEMEPSFEEELVEFLKTK